jgi:hypothetical protein
MTRTCDLRFRKPRLSRRTNVLSRPPRCALGIGGAEQCRLLGVKRKTCARTELFRFWPSLCKTFFPLPKTSRDQGRSASTRWSEHIIALSGPEPTLAHAWGPLSDLNGHTMRKRHEPSGPDCYQKRLDTDDVHHAREIVGEHVQRHLSCYLRQRLHQKVRRPHPHLQRGERMLYGSSPAAVWRSAVSSWLM